MLEELHFATTGVGELLIAVFGWSLIWGPFFLAWLCKVGPDPARYYGDWKIRLLVRLMREAIVLMVVCAAISAIANHQNQNRQ